MTRPLLQAVPDVELYTREQFLADAEEVKRETAKIRKASDAVERDTLKTSRLMYRMRHDGESYWPGKKNDRDFILWALAEQIIDSVTRGKQFLTAGAVVNRLEKSHNVTLLADVPLPVAEGQVRPLATKYLRGLDDADKVLADLWVAAVEECGGQQPTMPVVAEIAKRYTRDRKGADDGPIDPDVGLDDQTEKVATGLRRIRKELSALYSLEPDMVLEFVRELSTYEWPEQTPDPDIYSEDQDDD